MFYNTGLSRIWGKDSGTHFLDLDEDVDIGLDFDPTNGRHILGGFEIG